MEKREIKHKLEQARMDRDLAHIQANKEIDRLEAQLAEAEKSKLRHGDFGLNKNGKERITVFHSGEDGGGRDDYCSIGIVNDSDITIFGNIFDLMKDWGKNFKNVVLENSYDSRVFLIQKSLLNERDIYLGTEDRGKRMGVYLTKSEAYEIWLKLGHALAELKKKKSQE